jgi:NAD(P)-dependent dehydrogenase (short-subunit alcohol dehydrogenase family)
MTIDHAPGVRDADRMPEDASVAGPGAQQELAGQAALVVGGSRGLGRGISVGLAAAGASVVAVARDGVPLAELTVADPRIRTETADATDPRTARDLLERHRPELLVLVAGATPVMAPLQDQTWETFSVNWHADVRMAFEWLGEALRRPLARGSRIVVVSSGAAVHGSPASGGYAGAKATQRLIASYAQDESDRAGLGLIFQAVLPGLTPAGSVGRSGIRGYATRSGRPEAEFLAGLGEPLTAEVAGRAVVSLVAAPATGRAFLLTAGGVRVLS